MKRNELSNMALYISGIGEIVILAISVAILYGIHSRASAEQNNWGLSTLIAFGSAAWLILAIPWFVLEKRRPGQRVPMGKNLLTAGWWQLQRAATQIWKLKQSLAFLIGRYRPFSFPQFAPPPPPFHISPCRRILRDQRLLLLGRQPQHHRHHCSDLAERSPSLRHHPISLFAHDWPYGANRGRLHFLDYPTQTKYQHQDHVQHCCGCHHLTGLLGHARYLDSKGRVPPPLGVLDVREKDPFHGPVIMYSCKEQCTSICRGSWLIVAPT